MIRPEQTTHTRYTSSSDSPWMTVFLTSPRRLHCAGSLLPTPGGVAGASRGSALNVLSLRPILPAWPHRQRLVRSLWPVLIFLLVYCFIRFVFCLMLPDHESPSHSCPHCGAKMKLARIIPKLDILPKLTAFQCLDCREIITVEGDG
jgi:hypothetical protein